MQIHRRTAPGSREYCCHRGKRAGFGRFGETFFQPSRATKRGIAPSASPESAEQAAQAAVTPTGPNPAASPSPSIPLTLPTEISSAPQAEQGNKYKHIQPQPKPAEQQPWLSRPIRGGCVKGSSTSTSHVQTTTSAGQFAVLEEDDEAELPACGRQVEPTSPSLGSVVVDLTADVRTEGNRSSRCSSLSPG